MTIKSLENTAIEEIANCFIKAFANYFVPMPNKTEYYKMRWHNSKVDFSYSYGAFDSKKLVGFILNAIDNHNGIKTAYNAGTGVLPKFRSKNFVQKLYGEALTHLAANGVKKCLLEVITDNSAAIKTYQHIGFQITRTLCCFKGNLAVTKTAFSLSEKKLSTIDFNVLPNQSFYPWEFQHTQLQQNSGFQYFEVKQATKAIGYFILNTKDGVLGQLEVFKNTPTHWHILFCALQSVSKTITANNVDALLADKIEAIKIFGLQPTLNQYEMEMVV